MAAFGGHNYHENSAKRHLEASICVTGIRDGPGLAIIVACYYSGDMIYCMILTMMKLQAVPSLFGAAVMVPRQLGDLQHRSYYGSSYAL